MQHSRTVHTQKNETSKQYDSPLTIQRRYDRKTIIVVLTITSNVTKSNDGSQWNVEDTVLNGMSRTSPGKIAKMSGNRSSLKIDLITEDPKIRKHYYIEKSITNNRNTGNKSLYNCTKKIKILFNSSKHENILS